MDVSEKIIITKEALSNTLRHTLFEIGEKCPVHRTLTGDVSIHRCIKVL